MAAEPSLFSTVSRLVAPSVDLNDGEAATFDALGLTTALVLNDVAGFVHCRPSPVGAGHIGTMGERKELPAVLRQRPAFQQLAAHGFVDLLAALVFRGNDDGVFRSRGIVPRDRAMRSEAKLFLGEAEQIRGKVNALVGEAITLIVGLETSRATFEQAFSEELSSFLPKYQVVREQRVSLQTLFDESVKLQAETKEAERNDRVNKEHKLSLESARTDVDAARVALRTKNAELDDLLTIAAANIPLISDHTLQANVVTEELPRQYCEALGTLCENQRIRESVSKCQERVRAFGDQTSDLRAFAVKLLAIYETKIKETRTFGEAKASTTAIAQLQAMLFPLTPVQAQGIYAALDDAKIIACLNALPEDYIAFKYKEMSGYIRFELASPGQQAAALLHLLSKQDAGTLIIDQPEDDLDNQVVINREASDQS